MDYKESLYYSQLFDIYGELLTKNQKDVFEDYYFNNLSLSEIAENRDISRQAVDFTLKKTLAILKNLEESLHFNKKMRDVVNDLDKILNEQINDKLKEKIRKIISKIKE